MHYINISSFTEQCVQKKWKNVRDRYAREINSRAEKPIEGMRKKRPYVYNHQLSFLRDIVTIRRKSPTFDKVEIVEEVDEDAKDPLAESGTFVQERQLSPFSHTPLRERINNSEENDNRLFLLSLLPSMELIPPHLKLTARMDIMEVVHKYSCLTNTSSTQKRHHS